MKVKIQKRDFNDVILNTHTVGADSRHLLVDVLAKDSNYIILEGEPVEECNCPKKHDGPCISGKEIPKPIEEIKLDELHGYRDPISDLGYKINELIRAHNKI